MIRKVPAALRLLRSDSAAFRDALLRVDAFEIFVARPEELPGPESLPGIRFARMTDEQMRTLAPDWEEQARRVHNYGFNAAYGVYVDGTLAHINWLITAEYDSLRRHRIVKLSEGEAEIAHGYTLPQFRRRGLQVFCIRALAQVAAANDIRRLYSITVADNTISMRGITSAGLVSYARSYRLVFARNLFRVVIRGHRLPWRLLLKRDGSRPRQS